MTKTEAYERGYKAGYRKALQHYLAIVSETVSITDKIQYSLDVVREHNVQIREEMEAHEQS